MIYSSLSFYLTLDGCQAQFLGPNFCLLILTNFLIITNIMALNKTLKFVSAAENQGLFVQLPTGHLYLAI